MSSQEVNMMSYTAHTPQMDAGGGDYYQSSKRQCQSQSTNAKQCRSATRFLKHMTYRQEMAHSHLSHPMLETGLVELQEDQVAHLSAGDVIEEDLFSEAESDDFANDFDADDGVEIENINVNVNPSVSFNENEEETAGSGRERDHTHELGQNRNEKYLGVAGVGPDTTGGSARRPRVATTASIRSGRSRRARRGVLHEPNEEQRLSAADKQMFDWNRYFMQLLYHLLGFFAIPIMIFKEGPIFMSNTLFVPMRKGKLSSIMSGWLLQQFNFLLMVAVNFMYFYLQPKGVGLVEIIVIDILIWVRASAIASKYAIIPKSLYDRLHLKYITPTSLVDLLLLGGWTTGKPSVIEQELCNAERLLNTDLTDHFFFVEKKGTEIKNEDEDEDEKKLKDALRVLATAKNVTVSKEIDGQRFIAFPCRAVAIQVLLDAYEACAKPKLSLAFILTLIRISIQIIVPLVDGSGDPYMFYDWQSATVGALAILVMIIFYQVDLGYVIAAVRDFNRRLFTMQQMNSLIARGYSGFNCSRATLRLDLRFPDNIVGWLNTRHVLRAYARRWKLREEAFLATFLIFILFSFIILLLEFLFGHSLAAATLNVKDMLLVVYDSIVFSILGIQVFRAASKSNEVWILQKKTLRSIKAHYEAEWWSNKSKMSFVLGRTCHGVGGICKKTKKDLCSDGDGGEYERKMRIRYEAVETLLASACDLVEEDDKAYPVHILGVPPSMKMARSLFGVVATAILAMMQKITGVKLFG